ncbi:hypothetical protein PS862_05673 [Pseudomonas fluorescens]|uniref:Uncharacterized protein n=1 Tax=Pseudomonas fluorescens TaxID=294 RepID=A0A5E7Q112_PSEFL|nr:hypothetical protein PS862_05673 [Pseudomonas fluorescens]
MNERDQVLKAAADPVAAFAVAIAKPASMRSVPMPCSRSRPQCSAPTIHVARARIRSVNRRYDKPPDRHITCVGAGLLAKNDDAVSERPQRLIREQARSHKGLIFASQ